MERGWGGKGLEKEIGRPGRLQGVAVGGGNFAASIASIDCWGDLPGWAAWEVPSGLGSRTDGRKGFHLLLSPVSTCWRLPPALETY